MRKKLLSTIIILVLIFVAWAFLRFVIGGPEDTWICDNGQWVKHGNPKALMPDSSCGEQLNQNQDISNEIVVSQPQANAIISGTIQVMGQARGQWFFEAVFPVQLINENEELISQTQAHAQEDWTTENFVPFEAQIEVPAGFSGNATLILRRDNPSGLPEYDRELRIPVKIIKADSSRQTEANLILLNIPFLAQAPFGQWEDPIYQNACEEASLLMAILWVRGEEAISKDMATNELKKFADFEIERYNNFYDHSAADTAQLMKDYFNYYNVEVKNDIFIEDIKRELQKGNAVIVPIDGRSLKNPFYTQPGPPEHMLLIKGYDSGTGEFITNDAGTRHGENYRYNEDILWESIRDYPTGYKEPITETRKPMIIVWK